MSAIDILNKLKSKTTTDSAPININTGSAKDILNKLKESTSPLQVVETTTPQIINKPQTVDNRPVAFLPPSSLAGGGAYYRSPEGRLVKDSEHPNIYGNLPLKTGYERADNVPVGLGGVNALKENISYEKMLPKDQQAPFVLTATDKYLKEVVYPQYRDKKITLDQARIMALRYLDTEQQKAKGVSPEVSDNIIPEIKKVILNPAIDFFTKAIPKAAEFIGAKVIKPAAEATSEYLGGKLATGLILGLKDKEYEKNIKETAKQNIQTSKNYYELASKAKDAKQRLEYLRLAEETKQPTLKIPFVDKEIPLRNDNAIQDGISQVADRISRVPEVLGNTGAEIYDTFKNKENFNKFLLNNAQKLFDYTKGNKGVFRPNYDQTLTPEQNYFKVKSLQDSLKTNLANGVDPIVAGVLLGVDTLAAVSTLYDLAGKPLTNIAKTTINRALSIPIKQAEQTMVNLTRNDIIQIMRGPEYSTPEQIAAFKQINQKGINWKDFIKQTASEGGVNVEINKPAITLGDWLKQQGKAVKESQGGYVKNPFYNEGKKILDTEKNLVTYADEVKQQGIKAPETFKVYHGTDDMTKKSIETGDFITTDINKAKSYGNNIITKTVKSNEMVRPPERTAETIDEFILRKEPKTTMEDPLIQEAKKYKTTINIQDKNDLEYLGRILSQDQIADIKAGKMTNFRGKPYEDLARVNIISETPKTIEQQLSGKIKEIKLKSDTFYHGTNAENARSIMKTGFKRGSELPEETFRGGGYGKMQSSISLAETPKDASRFSTLTKDGEIVEAKLKPNAKVVSIDGVEDAVELEDYISYLKKQKVDAVYIGGGEKELVVINPKAITPTKSQLTDIWNKANKPEVKPQESTTQPKLIDNTTKIVNEPIKSKSSQKLPIPEPIKEFDNEILNEFVAKEKTQPNTIKKLLSDYRQKTDELSILKVRKSTLEDVVGSDPASEMEKYVSKRLGTTPEVLGHDKGIRGSNLKRWQKEGDQIAQELGYEDSESAREAIDKYLKNRSELKSINSKITEINKFLEEKNVKASQLDLLAKKTTKFKDKIKLITSRRDQIKAIRDFFGLSDSDLRKISKKDPRLMSQPEFDKYINEFAIRAANYQERQQVVNEYLTQARRLSGVENLLEYLKKPKKIEKISSSELKDLTELLSKYPEGDQFLTVRQLQTMNLTKDLKGATTKREVLDYLTKRIEKKGLQGVNFPVSIKNDLGKIFVTDTKLAKSLPIFDLIKDDEYTAKIIADNQVAKIQDKIDELINASRKSRPTRTLVEKITGQDREIFEYLSADEETKAKLGPLLTPEEFKAATFIENEYRIMRDKLIEQEALKAYRNNYITNVQRPFSESLLESGIKKAIQEAYKKNDIEEAVFKIIDDTGELLPYEKWFKFAMKRTGNIDPTKNVARAFMTYYSAFQRKQALDSWIPTWKTVIEQLTPLAKTPRGLIRDESLKKFFNAWVNTKKGRPMKWLVTPGETADRVIRNLVVWTRLLDLGLNLPVGLISQVGENISTIAATNIKTWLTGVKRLMTKNGRNIIANNLGAIERTVPQSLKETGKTLVEKGNELLLGLFRSSSTRANKIGFLGSLTKEELSSGIVTPERVTEIFRNLSRYRAISDFGSMVSKTSPGAAALQYKTWAQPILETLFTNSVETINSIRSGENPLKNKESRELFLVALSGLGAYLMFKNTNQKPPQQRTMLDKMIINLEQELTTLVGALDPVRLTNIRTLEYLKTLSSTLKQLVLAQKQATTGNLSALTGLKTLFVPSAIKQFIPNEQTKEKTAIENLYKELKNLPENERQKRLDELSSDEYRSLSDYAKEKKMTPKELELSKLNVKDGIRAKAIKNELDNLKTPEEKNNFIDRLDELGIYTDTVDEQLRQILDQSGKPTSFIQKLLGINKAEAATIKKPKVPEPVILEKSKMNEDQYYKVLSVVMAEALAEVDKGKRGVVNVIFNRVGKMDIHNKPVNSAWDAISEGYNPKTGRASQFSSFDINNNIFKKVKDYLRGGKTELSKKEKEALDTIEKDVKLAIQGKLPDVTGGATHYLNPKTASDKSWIESNHAVITARIGNHVFAKVGKDYQRPISKNKPQQLAKK